jgi:nitrate reductase alpha subunit
MAITRRSFFKLTAGVTAGAAAIYAESQMAFLQAAPDIPNPLAHYPNRDWEKTYRNQYAYDSSFEFICAPNDTHMCRLRAMVRNGVVTRIEQNYDGNAYKDPQGNSSSVAWNPRACLKGYTLHRRVYGPYRAKNPAVRQGWKQWADDGFPSLSDNPSLRTKYKFDARGDDSWIRLSWDEANDYVAKGLVAIATTYSGADGKRRLVEKDGYPAEMLEHWEEAGTRTMKFGSSLPPHGIAGKFAPFRFSNMLGLLDAKVRGIGPDQAIGARGWSEYTWRGDQAPGFPFVHGLQSTETDFNDLRHSKLLVMVGKNLVENKMADSHFFHETMERGGKIVTIVPEYGPPATKSDYWIPVRPGLSDTALLLGVAKALIDRDLVDVAFAKRFTDLPLLVRLDTLKRLRADELIKGYSATLDPAGPSIALHGMTADQARQVGDRVVFDATTNALRPLTREDVGDRMTAKKIDPLLDYRGKAKLADGSEVEVASVLAMYREHLKDYDLDSVVDMTGAPKHLIEQLITDLATIKPAAIHIGEGINHYFHATLHNRAAYLLAMLTGNIGRYGSGVSTWAGNYKGGIFHAAPWYGPGVGGYTKEDPFNPVLDPAGKYSTKTMRECSHDEETAYWGFGDRPLVVDTPKAGRKMFTGTTHMPTPTKVFWFNNANLINQAKWAYNLIKNVNPKVDLIVDQEIEWTGSSEFSDISLPANSWLETQSLEMGGSCSNPFLQIWKGGIPTLNDTRDDIEIFAGVARALTAATGEQRFADYFKFSKTPEVYLDRVLAGSFTTKGYNVSDIMAAKYGVHGGALFQYRSYPRIPFKEQVEDSLPFYTDTGRMNAYVDIPEAIEYGENLIVHREAVEATPYLPNVIVSTSPYIRPNDYGIPLNAASADLRSVRNVKMSWPQVKATTNPLWDQGYKFYFLTPKSRHSTHSSWAVTDWNWIWNGNFSDPYREDKRLPGIGDVQVHMNPDDAKALGIADGDYVWIDANPEDRPYIGHEKDASFMDVARLMGRANFNPGFPRGVTMVKHAFNMATPRTVRAQTERADGRALAAGTGYQASFRHGSQQSVTRGWAPPMHQTDTLFHKKAGGMGFVFGYDEDNHSINTTPKETLVRITKAENGGLGGNGPWKPGTSGKTPGAESDFMKRYMAGSIVTVKGVV